MRDKLYITPEQAAELYHVNRWGNGFFSINANGDLCVQPEKRADGPRINIGEVIEEMKSKGITLPVVIRFHDVLRSQVRMLNTTFRRVIEEIGYEGRYVGVYPVKVNQMREVVEEIVDAGRPYDYGLEAGSKSELLAVLAYNTNTRSLTVLNGFKDDEYIRLALLGRKLERKVIIVVENYAEFKMIIRQAEAMNVRPLIGLRAKMSVKGHGRWAGSSGERAKFGLTASEMLSGIDLLRRHGLDDCVTLLHFHMGSQISDIRYVKEAVNEGGRIFAELVRMGVNIEYFDVGGGMGVDYDGTRSSTDSSKNYTLEEYASDIVIGLKQICDEANVHHPNIVSESGRHVTAHHSCVITNVIEIKSLQDNHYNTKKITGEHILVTNMRETVEEITPENYQEMFNDAQQYKKDSVEAFKFGVISLEERAKIETLYKQGMDRIADIVEDIAYIPEELQQIDELQSKQFLCNFSVFQSAADSWAIGQLLPIMPVMRLTEQPMAKCTLFDITCDSDGKIDKFIGRDGYEKSLLLHDVRDDEEYYVGVFLTGAYQDVMGDMHNLFGRLNEVHVYCDDDDPSDFYIEEIITGSSTRTVLAMMQYNPEIMAHTVKRKIDRQVARGKIQPREGVRLIDFYENCLEGYTYLKRTNSPD